VEVIIVVMKPLSEGSYINQAMKDGKGVVWFDDCRVPYKDSDVPTYGQGGIREGNIIGQLNGKERNWTTNTNGRFPANLLVSDDILNDHSKFFSLDAWAERNLPFMIVPKAPKKEKNLGVECFGNSYVCLECENKVNITQLRFDQPCGNCGGQVGEKKVKGNTHPTVKPMKLMSYLITLGSREGDVILDPFSGSGTTACAAIQLNRKFIAIEKEEEYIEIIKARIEYFHDTTLLKV